VSQNNYETEDIYLSAYLISSGKCRLVQLANSGPQKKKFLLNPPPDNKDIDSFYTGTGKVSALELCNRLRSLKAAVKVRGV